MKRKTAEDASVNAKLKILGISGGMGLKKRLSDLGLTLGSEITVIRNDRVGPILIKVRGTNIAIGRRMAGKIQVEEH